MVRVDKTPADPTAHSGPTEMAHALDVSLLFKVWWDLSLQVKEYTVREQSLMPMIGPIAQHLPKIHLSLVAACCFARD